MASCGSLITPTSTCADSTSTGHLTCIVWRPPSLVRAVICLLLLLGTVSCGTPSFDDGRPAPTDKIKSLQSGVSTKPDVRSALGQPRGYGMLRHNSEQATRRTIWYYEYVQVKDDQIGVKILLVFFNVETYDGYLWFAAKELTRRGEP